MQLTITGDTELGRRLSTLNDVLKRTFWIGVQEDYKKNLDRNIKPHTKTTRMERNAYVDLIDNGVEGGVRDNGMLVDWRGAKVNYGIFVHEGTRAHPILPKNKKALRFVSGGNFVFSKKVNHPGYKGDPFLMNAAQETFKKLDKIFSDELKNKGVV